MVFKSNCHSFIDAFSKLMGRLYAFNIKGKIIDIKCERPNIWVTTSISCILCP